MTPGDELRGHQVCVPLARIEPATSAFVRSALYPMSYRGTSCRNYIANIQHIELNLWVVDEISCYIFGSSEVRKSYKKPAE